MSYRIDYAAPEKPGQNPQAPALRRLVMGFGFFVLFSLLVHAFWSEGRDVLKTLLFGEHSGAVLAAMEDIADRLRGGMPLREAAVAVCRELIYGA